MYASSTIPPSSNQESAILTQHNQPHATVTLDLSIPIVLAGAVGPVAGASSTTARAAASSTAPGGAVVAVPTATASVAPASGVLGTTVLARTSRDMILIAHAVIASLGLLLFTPAAILIARYLRAHSWFPMHAALQLLASACLIAAFALGYVTVRGRHFYDSHTRLGLTLLILVLVQVTLGALAHRVASPAPSPTSKLPTLSNKPLIRLIHIVLGITITGLGLIQVRLGMSQYPEKSDGGEGTPVGVIVVYWLLVAAIVISYLYGWASDGKRTVRSQEGPVVNGVEGEKGENKL